MGMWTSVFSFLVLRRPPLCPLPCYPSHRGEPGKMVDGRVGTEGRGYCQVYLMVGSPPSQLDYLNKEACGWNPSRNFLAFSTLSIIQLTFLPCLLGSYVRTQIEKHEHASASVHKLNLLYGFGEGSHICVCVGMMDCSFVT